MGEHEHWLLMTMHHIVSDGWSMAVFFKELQTLYGAFARNAATPLPELPIQYGDFSAWQRESMQGPLIEEHLSYWRAKLAGAPTRTPFPSSYPPPSTAPRPAAQSTGPPTPSSGPA